MFSELFKNTLNPGILFFPGSWYRASRAREFAGFLASQSCLDRGTGGSNLQLAMEAQDEALQ